MNAGSLDTEGVRVEDDPDVRSETSFTVVGSPEVRGGGLDALGKKCVQYPIFSESTTVGPETLPSDVTLISSDCVLFRAHRHLLFLAGNGFARLLSSHADASASPLQPRQLIQVEENAAVLATILSAIYSTPPGSLASLETLAGALKALRKYDVLVQELAVPHRPLGEQLLAHTPLAPMDVFVLAAEYELEAIAVHASSRLLAYPLARLPEDLALRMGGRYLRRLCLLQSSRMAELKRMLYAAPDHHPATPRCGLAERRRLDRAWALAVATLAWNARADMSPLALQGALLECETSTTCDECKEALRTRVSAITKRWTILENTI